MRIKKEDRAVTFRGAYFRFPPSFAAPTTALKVNRHATIIYVRMNINCIIHLQTSCRGRRREDDESESYTSRMIAQRQYRIDETPAQGPEGIHLGIISDNIDQAICDLHPAQTARRS